ncbi:MAG: hypothetical protein P1U89_08410 [Verrucomicrobiales bacterium]|nr:hypothetical protein [Verrucomicrobiales bacterium]
MTTFKAGTVTLLVFLTTLLSVGCKDINEVKPQQETATITEPSSHPRSGTELSPKPGLPETTFPFDRMLEDSQGRKIDATVLAKSGGEIGIVKPSSSTAFMIPISRLSEADQSWFSTIEDGGNFAEVQELITRQDKLKGRIATWNTQLYNAEKEAERLGIPLLAIFVFNDDQKSSSLERNVLYTKAFRDWANRNAALFLMRLDKTTDTQSASLSNDDNREVASPFGVHDDITFVLIPTDHPPVGLKSDSFRSVTEAIAAIESLIANPSAGAAISPIAIPRKASRSKGKSGKGGKGGK